MIARPGYFDRVRASAAEMWDDLERRPVMAAPWHLLFKQVQSPRHVLSELLQNADDARASEAVVSVVDHTFVFSHDGEDFTEEQFASLCRFGYSNKRALHTIGFRGMGFKSTFSLGDVVELRTPTLCVAFRRARFTEPTWIEPREAAPYTEVRVAIADAGREREVLKNLDEWLKSPVSLLFFKNLRALRINGRELRWCSRGPGPVQGTEWMALGETTERYLVARSAAEAFPSDALAEIKEERSLGFDDEMEFPPCHVELVLGAGGRLHVVLPTGVDTALPFRSNAPFIQDPARMKIKDPETSPTNHWLLERIGRLAGDVMAGWLADESLPVEARAVAYALLPDVDRDDGSLEGACASAVEIAVDAVIRDRAILLLESGKLGNGGHAAAIPDVLLEVWPGEDIAQLFGLAPRQVLSRSIARSDVAKLAAWGLIEDFDKDDVVAVLRLQRIPRPKTWRSLARLWAYLGTELTGWMGLGYRRELHIVPVQGHRELYSANEVVRLGEARLLQSDDDWAFLGEHLLVLNPYWPRFLAEEHRDADASDQAEPGEAHIALIAMKTLGLDEASNADSVLDRVASDVFSGDGATIDDSVRLAQIAAKLSARAGAAFRFVTRDGASRSVNQVILFDGESDVGDLLPAEWCAAHVLAEAYTYRFRSCSPDDWRRWIDSGRSGLLTFVPPRSFARDLWDRETVERELERRGGGEPYYPYVTNHFRLTDQDFDPAIWREWERKASTDPTLWRRVVRRIVASPRSYAEYASGVRVEQVATTGNTKTVSYGPLRPGWALKLEELRCVPDTHGTLHRPPELLRRTPQTEPYLDVEPFVDARLDTEAARPLLVLLGVKDTPVDARGLLTRLRALAKSPRPPLEEVDKWYRRLDQVLDDCATDVFEEIVTAFRDERIILTADHGWEKKSAVFIAGEDEIPGLSVIRPAVRELSLWRRIGIEARPTIEAAMAWLGGLPSGKSLSKDDERRVRALLGQFPTRIWDECGHWLSLSREWVPVHELQYSLTMQSLVEWSHLYDRVKRSTADLQVLSADLAGGAPFAVLLPLAAGLGERLAADVRRSGRTQSPPWLSQLGADLERARFESPTETARVRVLASRLARTTMREVPGLSVIPYIEGVPAGTGRPAASAWIDDDLFVEPAPKARLARLIPERLARQFGRPDVTAALNYAFGRSEIDVAEYMAANFTLEEAASPEPRHSVDSSTTETSASSAAISQGVTGTEDHAGAAEASLAVLTPAQPVATVVDTAQLTTELAGVGQSTGQPARILEQPNQGNAAVAHPVRQRRHGGPSLIERFAAALGFVAEGEDTFRRDDGSSLIRVHEEPFPWEQHAHDGSLTRAYLVRAHCLALEALELEADVWALLESFPSRYSLVLSEGDGTPVEMAGTQLRTMRDSGDLRLYPATYRLLLEQTP